MNGGVVKNLSLTPVPQKDKRCPHPHQGYFVTIVTQDEMTLAINLNVLKGSM
jgi:hypothetical protein